MVPRAVGTGWEVRAPAKLNLYLEVYDRRSDGFHDLETLMLPVRLFDHLHWSAINPILTSNLQGQLGACSLSVSDRRACRDRQGTCPDLASSDNLVLKAARLLAERAQIEPHGHFQLTKRIPLEAGLGGGSSDAAAALVLANRCWNAGLTQGDLLELAAELGSDVPFFLHSGAAVCRGRGELVECVAGLGLLHLVLVKPAISLSTRAVFGKLADSPVTPEPSGPHRLAEMLQALQRGALATAARTMFNRLESTALRIAPEIRRIKQQLVQAGCHAAMLTGSGSTVFGMARSAVHCRRTANGLRAQGLGRVYATTGGG